MLALALLLILATFDRLIKVISLRYTDVTPSPHGVIFFQGSLNMIGPLGLSLPNPVLLVLTIIIGAILAATAIWQKHFFGQFSFGLLALGIISNGLDRVTYSGIVDCFRLWGGLIFNLADIYIISAIIIFLFYYFFSRPSLPPPRR